jgi:single-strand DNA-binding protein
MSRSLNKVCLIGNLTRDVEKRLTPSGTSVASFGLATNRSWTVDGQRNDETEFHSIVAWSKLADICEQFLKKGSKVYVEGRLSTREWTTKEGQKKQRTEIVADDVIILDNKGKAPVEAPAEASAEQTDENTPF